MLPRSHAKVNSKTQDSLQISSVAAKRWSIWMYMMCAFLFQCSMSNGTIGCARKTSWNVLLAHFKSLERGAPLWLEKLCATKLLWHMQRWQSWRCKDLHVETGHAWATQKLLIINQNKNAQNVSQIAWLETWLRLRTMGVEGGDVSSN